MTCDHRAVPLQSLRSKREKDIDFERVVKLAAALISLMGAVAYCFALGYCRMFEIPVNPSFGDAVTFYFSSVLNICSEHPACNAFFVVPALAVAARQSIASSKWGTSVFGWIVRHESKLRALGFSCLIVASLIIAFSRKLELHAFFSAFQTFAVLQPIVFVSVAAVLFYIDSTAIHNKVTAHFLNGMLFAISFVLSCNWAFHAGYSSLSGIESISSHLTVGYGIGGYDPSYLLWSTESQKFWFRCEPDKGIIYASGNSGAVSQRTIASERLYSDLCPID